MEIDLFMEVASPPTARRDAERLMEETLALARAAEATGFGAVWFAEHHFLGDYSNASAPDMLLAAIARETERIGLGFGIIPLPIHDPVRVVERLATLDALSGGRVMWGVGRGVTRTELEGFGVDPADSRAIFHEKFSTMQRILQTGIIERNGMRLEVRPRPSSRLRHGWMAAVSPESFDLAADLGLDVMSGPFKPWPMVKADLRRYRRRRPAGRVSFTLAAYCEPDHDAARRRAADGVLWAYRKLFEVAAPFLRQQVETYEHYRRLGRFGAMLESVLSLGLLEKMGLAAIGSPDHVARRLGALEAYGVDRVSLVIGGGDLTQAETIRCVELLRAEVMPRLGGTARAHLREATV